MSPPALQAVSIVKKFPGGAKALRGVDLMIAQGETLALIGESGCGKSTLLRLFNRMLEPSSGHILVHGRRAAELEPNELRRGIGYVQQNGGLIPHWNVERNVALVPALLGWDPARRSGRSREMLTLAGLDPDIHARRYPWQLSGGERQRVAFARALAADPPIVLLDEPFAALDALTRRRLQEEFLSLKMRLAKTLLIVTHDLDEALLLGDRVAVMRRGRVLQVDAPRDLVARPATSYVRELLAMASERGKRAGLSQQESG